MPKPIQLQAVLFDLDGTLVDTAPDLAAALNACLLHYNLPPIPYETIRPYASNGTAALAKLGFGQELPDADLELRRRFIYNYYQDNIAVHSGLFAGMEQLLDTLQQQKIKLAVVTNKPAALTDTLLQQLQLSNRFNAIVSGDTLPQRKPDPQPLLHACAIMDCNPRESLYVGDALRDITAAHSANMPAIAAAYGYLHTPTDALSWQADATVDSPEQLLNLITTWNKS